MPSVTLAIDLVGTARCLIPAEQSLYQIGLSADRWTAIWQKACSICQGMAFASLVCGEAEYTTRSIMSKALQLSLGK